MIEMLKLLKTYIDSFEKKMMGLMKDDRLKWS